MIICSHTPPCNFADRFCKPTTKKSCTFVWFSDNFCLVFAPFGRITKPEEHYGIETDSFIHASIPSTSETTYRKKGTSYFFVHAPHTQTPNNPSRSRFHTFPHAQIFCHQSDLFYSTQCSAFFVTRKHKSKMNTK